MERPKPSDDLREATLDAAFKGLQEDFQTFNDAYSEAVKKEPGPKLLFGAGSGSKVESTTTKVTCPDCGKSWKTTGISFSHPDFPMTNADRENLQLFVHRYPFPPVGPDGKVHKDWKKRGCPAYVQRAKVITVMEAMGLRKIAHFGLGHAWRSPKWTYADPIRGPIWRALRWKERQYWVLQRALQRFVGIFEQRAWEKR